MSSVVIRNDRDVGSIRATLDTSALNEVYSRITQLVLLLDHSLRCDLKPDCENCQSARALVIEFMKGAILNEDREKKEEAHNGSV